MVDMQWNMIRPFKVGNSDNEPYGHYIKWNKPDQKRRNVLWFHLYDISKQVKSKAIKTESNSQGSKTVHVSQNPPSFPWGNWLLMTSPNPIIQIIGSHIQSNECRHNFTMYTNLTQTSQQTKGKIVSMVPQLCLKLYLQYFSSAYEI